MHARIIGTRTSSTLAYWESTSCILRGKLRFGDYCLRGTIESENKWLSDRDYLVSFCRHAITKRGFKSDALDLLQQIVYRPIATAREVKHTPLRTLYAVDF